MKTIRLATPEDARELSAIYGRYVTSTAISFEVEPPTEAEMKERIESILPLFPWLVHEKGGEILGYAYASRHHPRAAYRWSVDTAVYVRDGCQRRGIGRALYTSLLDILRLQGFCAAHAGITLPNAGSVGLHETMGYRRIGIYPRVGFKHGAWHDVAWWQLPLRDRSEAPEPPRPLDAARGDLRWDSALAAGSSLLDG